MDYECSTKFYEASHTRVDMRQLNCKESSVTHYLSQVELERMFPGYNLKKKKLWLMWTCSPISIIYEKLEFDQ